MAGLAVVLKYALPAVLAGGGLVAAVVVPDAAPAPPRQVWIDSPADGGRLVPGPVEVVAHAADGTRMSSMTLEVDGVEVDTRSDLTRFDLLAGVEFAWTATEGQHFLVVSGKGLRSATVAVDVGVDELGTPSPSGGATPTATPSESPTASVSPTEAATDSPTPTGSATPSTGPSTGPSATPTVEPTQSETPGEEPTPTPTEPPPPADPTVGAVTVNPAEVYAGLCTSAITVKAPVTAATGGSAVVTGGPVSRNIGGSVSGGFFTATFNQRDLTGQNVSGTFQVEVTVTNDTGFDVAAGSVTIACAKD